RAFSVTASGVGKAQRPSRWPHQSRGYTQKGGLAGAVAPRKNRAFSRSDGQRHSPQGEESAIALIDILKTETNRRKRRRRHPLTSHKIAQDLFGTGPFLGVLFLGNRSRLAAQLEPEQGVFQRIQARANSGIELSQVCAVNRRPGIRCGSRFLVRFCRYI